MFEGGYAGLLTEDFSEVWSLPLVVALLGFATIELDSHVGMEIVVVPICLFMIFGVKFVRESLDIVYH